jgi:CRISPR/Cas system CSM-associated protein Csm3 (group 7 of RAMP superfamily)
MEYKGMVPFIPDWGKYVSQDYPFEDGVSGKIALEITAESDIFVRDGSGDKSSDFSKINQRYFIPGTSIKGSLRSVLEIVSFGKLTRFNNNKVSKTKSININNVIPQEFQKKEKHDMAELMFGYTDENDSLRGRVHVSHAFAKGDPKPLKELAYILSSPHASYYPLYANGSKPWNSGPIIAGFKRYPTAYKNGGSKSNDESGQTGNGKMLSHIKPLPAGTKFSCEITFHNLKPEELGALLYVLDSRQIKYHQFGGLKPYRYGKVSIRPTLTLKDSQNSTDYVEEFRKLLKDNVNENWEGCSTIKELKSMAEGFCVNNSTLETFRYMTLNEYKDGKTCNKRFKPFSELKG